MPRIIKPVSIREWSADDVDKFFEYVTSGCKGYQVNSFQTDAQDYHRALSERFNKQEPGFGRWQLIDSHLLMNDLILCVMRRHALVPNENGQVETFKWVKEK